MADRDRAPRSIVLRPDDDALGRHAWLYGDTPGQRAVSLARALATSPSWQRLRDRAQLVVRPGPQPVIAVVGAFDERDDALLEALRWQVDDTLRRLRPVRHADVEHACEALAAALVDHLGRENLSSCRVLGLPRGGLIVAGLLAYAAGITREQLERPPVAGGPLVVVDDCMLSGARLRRWLEASGERNLVVAQLHSHPDLRRAVEQDPRVVRCVAAVDLHDHAPEQQGAGYEQWKKRWTARSPDDFWTGHADHVCYPWNEPDTLVWNEVAERAEPGWRVVPPAWCLKNRREGADAAADVQVCPEPRAVGVPPGIAWADTGDTMIVVDGDHGAALELSGVAADFWCALVDSEDLAAAGVALQDQYDIDADRLLADLNGFIEALTSRGLVRRTG